MQGAVLVREGNGRARYEVRKGSELGSALKAFREKNELDVEKVAKRIGRGRETLRRWEMGECLSAVDGLVDALREVGVKVVIEYEF